MVLVEPLHLLEQHCLFSNFGNVVNGLVKDRNVELFYTGSYLLTQALLFKNAGCLMHDRVSNFSQVLP